MNPIDPQGTGKSSRRNIIVTAIIGIVVFTVVLGLFAFVQLSKTPSMNATVKSDPSGQALMYISINGGIKDAPADMTQMWVTYVSHKTGTHYVIDAPPFNVTPDMTVKESPWPVVPIAEGATVEFVLATPEASAQIAQSSNDASGNLTLDDLPSDTKVITTPALLTVPEPTEGVTVLHW